MSVNSKITLKVKSGPGEIVGDTELEINNGSVNFDRIQFTEPGDYIISVIPSNSEQLESTEFSINVENEEIISQEDSGDIEESSEEINGTRPIIAQILQPSIKIEPIEFQESQSDIENDELKSVTGFTPLVWYNGIQIRISDINTLSLYYQDLIPNCKMNIIDTTGLITSDDSKPLNDTKIEIFLNSGSDILKSIHLKFKLESNTVNKNGTNTITGTIDVNDLYKKDYTSYDGTSFTVLKKVAKKLNLGYNSNITNSDDSMKWRKRGINYQSFLKYVTSHSYVSDDSFLMCYIDFYWCLNYVDLEKEWKRDTSKDVGLNTHGISSMTKQDIVPLVLSNDQSENSSSFYFTDYKTSNNSTKITTNSGVFTKYKAYDRKNKQITKFDIDSITSDSQDNIILKGAPGDSKYMKENYSNQYSGKIDIDNVHQNFLYAKELNKRNINNLINVVTTFILPQPNFNLYLYQKVKINFTEKRQTINDKGLVDMRLTGEWLIIDISYQWKNGKLSQKIKAVRKELGKTNSEKLNQKIGHKNIVDNSEINENPDI